MGATLVTGNPKDFRNFFFGLVISHPNGEEVVAQPIKLGPD